MAKQNHESFVCPHCGADVSVSAAACPECGSDEQTGWSEDTHYDGLDLPDPDLPDQSTPSPSRRILSTAIALVVLICVLLLILRAGG